MEGVAPIHARLKHVPSLSQMEGIFENRGAPRPKGGVRQNLIEEESRHLIDGRAKAQISAGA
jgi:hypothetical protein